MLGFTINASDFYNPRLDHPQKMRSSPTLSNGSFVTHSGNNGTPAIGHTRFVGGDEHYQLLYTIQLIICQQPHGVNLQETFQPNYELHL